MMQKNEALLLDPWIRYHTTLLGSENIYLFDNNSSKARVVQTLKNAEQSGVNVLWQYKTQDDYLNRGEIVAALINRLDEEHPYDFYFLLDCDEFLACLLRDQGTPSFRKQDIDDELNQYLGAKEVLVISHKYLNNILYPDHYTTSISSKKCFFAQGTCQSINQGYHNARSSRSEAEVKTGIVFFEFHYRPYAYQCQMNKQKLIGRIPDFSRKSLRLYVKKRSHSFHSAEELLQSQYEYTKGFLDCTELVAVPGLLATFNAVGIEHANLFESRSGINRTWNRGILLLRHGVSRRLSFLTDRLHWLYLRVARGLKGAFHRLAGSLRGRPG
jgi:hypothetical protein